jgi:hypothetical protein
MFDKLHLMSSTTATPGACARTLASVACNRWGSAWTQIPIVVAVRAMAVAYAACHAPALTPISSQGLSHRIARSAASPSVRRWPSISSTIPWPWSG